MKIRLLFLNHCFLLQHVRSVHGYSRRVSSSTGLTFIHMNDTYRVADVEDGTRGGFGRLTTVIRQIQAEGRDVRVLHGGDLLSPSMESEIWFGGQMVDALNFIDRISHQPISLQAITSLIFGSGIKRTSSTQFARQSSTGSATTIGSRPATKSPMQLCIPLLYSRLPERL